MKEIACKGPEPGVRAAGPWETIRCAMEPEALGVWQECVDRCRALFGHMPEWECANRFVDAFFEAYDGKDSLRYTLNHKVFERDGYRCTVPGCTSRGGLNSHHPILLSQGGPDTMPNQTSACQRHHHMAIHAGTVEVEGTAPDGLIWRLGVKANGEVLLTIGPGEKILPRSYSFSAMTL